MKKVLCAVLCFLMLIMQTGCLINRHPDRVTGIDGYLEHGKNFSEFGTTDMVLYSEAFLTGFTYLEGDYNYFENGEFSIFTNSEEYFEVCPTQPAYIEAR